MEGGHAPRRAAAEDGGRQRLPVAEVGEGLGNRELSARRRAGRLGVRRKVAARRPVRRPNLAAPRIRDPRRHAAGTHARTTRRGRSAISASWIADTSTAPLDRSSQQHVAPFSHRWRAPSSAPRRFCALAAGKPTDVRSTRSRFGYERASLSHAAEVRRHAHRSRHHSQRPLRRLVATGKSAHGFGWMPMGNVWSWPSQVLGYDQTLDAMKAVTGRIRDLTAAQSRLRPSDRSRLGARAAVS